MGDMARTYPSPKTPLRACNESTRYTERLDRKSRELAARELYDHQSDPAENTNVAGVPENRPLVEKLSRILDKGKGWKKMQR